MTKVNIHHKPLSALNCEPLNPPHTKPSNHVLLKLKQVTNLWLLTKVLAVVLLS